MELPAWPRSATPPPTRNLDDAFFAGGSSHTNGGADSAARPHPVSTTLLTASTPLMTVNTPRHAPRGAAAEQAPVFASKRALAFKECAEQDVALCLSLPPGAPASRIPALSLSILVRALSRSNVNGFPPHTQRASLRTVGQPE